MFKVVIYFIPILFTVAFPQLPNKINKNLLAKSDHAKIQTRVIGGQMAELGQFPYQAAILFDGWLLCGGSLISSQTVLTAAHCLSSNKFFHNFEELTVLVGAFNLSSSDEVESRQIFSVTKNNFVIHEHYEWFSLVNDIGLIHLPHEAQFNEYVKPIQLPQETDVNKSFEGEEVTLSGWGWTDIETFQAAEVLHYGQFKVYDQIECMKVFPGDISEGHICAIETDKSSCYGDSGGPLVYGEGDRIVIGITSFGMAYCPEGYPNVYTRVTSYLDWINKNMV